MLGALASSELQGQATPAGTRIASWAEVTYQAPNGAVYSVASDTLLMIVGQLAGVDVEPPRSATADPGATVVFSHTVANIGNGRDSLASTGVSRRGWPVSVHLDVDGDGFLDPGEPQLTGSLPLDMGESAPVLVVVQVPAGAATRGVTDTVDVRVASRFDPLAADATRDVVQVRDAGVTVALDMAADRASAMIGEIVTYTVTWTASGTGSATELEITDAIPVGATYVSGSLRMGAMPLTDASGDDDGFVDAAADRVVVRVGDVAAGSSGTIAFQVRVGMRAEAQRSIVNVAAAAYRSALGPETTTSNAVDVLVVLPEIAFDKQVSGPSSARSGETLEYRIQYRNASPSTPALEVVVIDTLPVGLDYVGSLPAAQVTGREVRWTLGDVAPGETADLALTVRVRDIADTMRVINRASVEASNAPPQVAAAPEVELIGTTASTLSLRKSADVLEVGLGELVPYVLVVENIGTTAHGALRIHDRLPDGMRVAHGSLLGADSVQVQDRELTIFLSGPLAAGETRTIRYAAAVVSASSTTLRNVAHVVAMDGSVRSADASAVVRVRSGAPMEQRAAIGKVFVDLDGDGAQGAGEYGIAGVDVWSDDGQVVTSDQDGRFTFRNLRPGRHGFRIDPSTVPAVYGLQDERSSAVIVRDASGWTMPRIVFRLVPREAVVARVGHAEPRVTMQERPVSRCPSLVSLGGDSHDRAVIARFDVRMGVVPRDVDELARTARWLARTMEHAPGCTIELHGHTDLAPLGPSIYVTNYFLSEARAHTVAQFLVGAGIDESRIRVRAFGDTRPIALSSHPDSLARNRRVELFLVERVLEDDANGNGHGEVPETRASTVDTIPSAAALAAGAVRAITLRPPRERWPGEAVLRIPTGWEALPGTSRLGEDSLPDPRNARDRDGQPMLHWEHVPRTDATLSISLRTVAPPVSTDTVQISPLRGADARAGDARRELTQGPGVVFLAPADGTVLRSDRAYVGVRGEPGAPVALFDGDSLLARATLRIDGQHDFIALQLTRGPHRLRVRITNSWKQERWDSVAVHVTGAPVRFVADQQRTRLEADGQAMARLRARALDAWGVPVTNRPFVTVSADGAVPLGPDADPSSVGVQLRADEAGWITIELRAGRDVVRGRLVLRAENAVTAIPLDVVPAARPLMVTAVGRAGIGASPDEFGAVSARGRIGERTAVTLTYDSRRLDAGRDAFGRVADPLDPSRYPILGDASEHRVEASSPYALSARLERDFDWLAFGDISTSGFGGGLELTSYRRALPGASAQLTTGALTWQAFGSSTTQSVRQDQIRGAGMSGPYAMASAARPGTEQVILETRALENPQRVISRQSLVRFVEYQVDYDLGTILLKQAVPATDVHGNPVFLVVTYEAEHGGERGAVWGARVAADARALAGGVLDSLRVGATFVQDAARETRTLGGVDVRLLRHAGVELDAEIAQSTSPDSTGIAVAARGSVTLLGGAVAIGGGWMRIGDAFANPANLAMRAGTEERQLEGRWRVGASELRLAHEHQVFRTEGVERARTLAGVTQRLGGNVEATGGVSSERYETTTLDETSRAAELEVAWTAAPGLRLWSEARHQFAHDGSSAARPDHVGVGAAFQIASGVALEARHRHVLLPDSGSYGVSNLGLRFHLPAGTEAWGSYQLAGADGAYNAAVVGLRNQVRLGSDWTIHTMAERRHGLARASVVDPVRALPFLQQEEDYVSFALGVELLPAARPYRLSTRGEYRDGDLRSNRLVLVAGDASVSRSLALLMRQELLVTTQNQDFARTESVRHSSLWGLAFRPTSSDALNALAKFEWRHVTNPMDAGVLATSGVETRLIGATDVVWAPDARLELSGRYALRRSVAEDEPESGLRRRLASTAEYVGARASVDVVRRVEIRGEARMLVEHASGTRRWDAAPQLAVTLGGLELAGGHRFGDLRDPDFAVHGGAGWFLTIGAAVTEHALPRVADFWRTRLAR